jgi:fatty acid-binding protein DegV
MNNIFDLIFFVIGIIIAFAMKDKFTTNDEVIEDIKKIIFCDTQTIDGQIYVWDKMTNEFLIQGKDMNEIVEYFKKNHPSTKVILTQKANEETRVQTNG